MRKTERLIIILALLTLSISATAQDIPNNEIWYTSYDNQIVQPFQTDVFGATIISNTYSEGKGVIKFDGNVTSIGYDAFAGATLKTITMPNSVTSIGENAFAKSLTLTSVIIPHSVTIIGDNAFHDCQNLESVSIPNSVKSIGSFAFSDCYKLTSVNIPNSVTSIEGGAFYNCFSLTSITIPNSVTSIGESAFAYCSSLTSVYVQWKDADKIPAIASKTFPYSTCDLYVPDGTIAIYQDKEYWNTFRNIPVKIPNNEIWYTASGKLAETTNANDKGLHTNVFNASIVSHTFSNGEGVITFSADVTNIGDIAFYYCGNMTSLTIPNSVSSIGDCVFLGCSNLTSIIIPNSLTFIGKGAFCDCCGLTSFTIPNSVTSIGDYVFLRCSGLTSITIPTSVTSICERAFESCSSLTSITIPNSVTSIGGCAFCNCSGLTSVSMTNSVSSIGDLAFSGCNGLTSLTIPNSVTSIGRRTFDGCSGLTSFTIPNSVKNIGDDAFSGCSSLSSLTIPNSVTSIGDGAFSGCSGLNSISVDKANINYDSRDNCNAIIEKASNTLIAGCSNTTIPNSVASIGNSAFSGCKGLTSITIPNNVTCIGNYAFSGCNGLTSITIPNSVTNIGNYAFCNCSGLTSITILNSVTCIGGCAFWDCSGLTSVMIPASVRSIGDFAFRGCSGLTSITIPNSVTSIGDYVFLRCDHLKKIEVYWIEPPLINEDVFNDYSATLYVPSISVSKYKVADVWKKFNHIESVNLLSVQQWESTQTTLKLKITDINDKTNLFEEIGVRCNGTYYKPNADGTVKIRHLEPGSSYNICGYVKYGGKYYFEDGITCKTKSLNPYIAINNLTANGVQAKGSYDKGDANVVRTTFSTSRYGTETECRNDKFTLTVLQPQTNYTIYYKVYYTYGENDEFSGHQVAERYFTTKELKMTMLQPRNVSSTSSVVAAETNLSDDETGAGFEWRKYDAPESLPSSKGKAIVYDGRMEGKINNLQPVYYKVRPYYESASGNVYYGDWMTFDPTDFSYFEPTVHTYDFLEGPAANAIEVRGYVMQGTDDVLEQGFEYWKTGGAASPRMMTRGGNEVMRVQATGQMMIATLKDLDYASDYVVRAYVTTAGGTVYGEERTFTTPEDPASGIEQVNSDEDTTSHLFPEGIYTVSGLKIEHISEPGIYICNGKKVLITKDQLSMEW